MTETIIHYDSMVQMALLSVVRDVLSRTETSGLPGNHHFYVTFRTTWPGVVIPPYLKQRYPDEMTIVVQNQFSNLKVTPQHFEISLSFNGKLEHLSIPFAALEGFFDPSVEFGLHFENAEADVFPDDQELPPLTEAHLDDTQTSRAAPPGNVVALDTFRKE